MNKLNVNQLVSVDFNDVNKYINQEYLKIFNERNTLAAQVEKLQGIISEISVKHPEAIPDYLMIKEDINGTDNE